MRPAPCNRPQYPSVWKNVQPCTFIEDGKYNVGIDTLEVITAALGMGFVLRELEP